ncbi:MAG: phosphotransferase family protein [Pseudomonadota bacterium]
MENERPTPLIDDLEGTRQKLENWISRQRACPVSISALSIPESTGMSNVTLLFTLSWEENGRARQEDYVGRLQPAISRPVFPSYDLTLQYAVMEALGDKSDIPVPALRGLETDTSVLGVQFYLMRRTDGRIPTDMPPYNMDGWMMHETSEEQRATLWRAGVDTMARFHQLDYRELGFGGLLEPGLTPLQQQLNYWRDYMAWAMEGRGHGICERALTWLANNQPEDEPTALCWGDARIGNIIFKQQLDGVAAVLDWEMATLGNPLQDLAWYNYIDSTFAEGLGMPRLAGLPSYEDTVAQWQAASGHSADDYGYYLIFAAMRYGLILSRIMLATGQDSEIESNFAVKLLEKHLDS